MAPETRPAKKSAPLTNPTIVGSIILLVAIVTTLLSYNANKGLPFVPTYDIKVAVPDAAELIPGSSEVRIGGARVGIVKDVSAVPPAPGRPAYALLNLALDVAQDDLPVDTRAQVRPRSILGAKFLDLTRGRSDQALAIGATIPLAQAREGVELDEAFKVFEPRTRRALQQTVINLGNGFAGRGGAFNETIGGLRGLMGPLQRTLEVLAQEPTGLRRLIIGADRASAALTPVAGALADFLVFGATTLAAIDAAGPQLDAALVAMPSTLDAARRGALAARPVLEDTSSLFAALRPGVEELPRASTALRGALTVGTPVLQRVPQLTRRLDTALALLGRIAREPTTAGAAQRLIDAVTSTRTTLRTILPAQVTCNTAGLFVRNIASVVSEGDASATWFDFISIVDPDQSFQAATQSAQLHANPVPVNDASQCETGNEPFEPGRRVGSPGGPQPARTELTSPPPGVLQRARDAGVIG